jgi:hypothetical protein
MCVVYNAQLIHLFDNPNSSQQRVQIMKPIIQLLFYPLISKYLLQYPILRHPQSALHT